MDNYYLYIGVTLLLFILYPLFLRRKIKKAEEHGDFVFKGVHILFNRKTNALRIAGITTSIMFLFLFAFVGVLFWGSSNLYGLSLTLLIEMIFLISFLVFVGSFLYNFYFLGLSVDYDYSGLGPLIEKSYEKDFLLVTQQGMSGVVSLTWRQISSVASSEDKMVFITKRSLLGPSKVIFSFASVEDANRFKTNATEYLKSV